MSDKDFGDIGPTISPERRHALEAADEAAHQASRVESPGDGAPGDDVSGDQTSEPLASEQIPGPTSEVSAPSETAASAVGGAASAASGPARSAGAAAPAGAPTGVVRRNVDLVGEYLSTIGLWTDPANVGDAEKMRALKQRRQDIVVEMAGDLAAQNDPRMVGATRYYAADTAVTASPAPSSRQYLSYVAQRDSMRKELYSGFPEGSAAGYARAGQYIAGMIAAGSAPHSEYAMLDVRRDTVRRNFNNPKFFLNIAQHYGSMRDEVLVDFDRGDLVNKMGRRRTDAYVYGFAKTFDDLRTKTANPEAPGTGTLEAFLRLRAAGTQIRQNPAAIFRIVDAKGSSNPDVKPKFDPAALNSKENPRSLTFSDKEMVIVGAALEQRPYSTGELSDFYDSLPANRRRDVMSKSKNKAFLFEAAYHQFLRQYADGDPKIGVTFAVLQKTASAVMSNDVMRNKMAARSPEVFVALSLFSPKAREATSKSALADFYENVESTTHYKHNAAAVAQERSGEIVGKVKSEKGKEQKDAPTLSAKNIDDNSIIEVVDGQTLRIAQSKEASERGESFTVRIGGVSAPKLGQKSLDGADNAGESAKANLENLLSRYKKSSLGISIEDNLGKGGATVDIRLPDGEQLAQRLVRDGFAAPDHTLSGSARFNDLARQAEASNTGLWKNGFFKPASGWGAGQEGPDISDEEKSRIANLVGLSMVGSVDMISNVLNHDETRIFTLPVHKWTTRGLARGAASLAVKDNPSRAKAILARNQELLKDLRARHAGLTEKEAAKLDALRKNAANLSGDDKAAFADLINRSSGLSKADKLAHDRLTMGSRLLSNSLVDIGALTKQERDAMDHPLVSRFGLPMETIKKGAKMAEAVGKETMKGTNKMVDAMISLAS